jgi:hypothetical protein
MSAGNQGDSFNNAVARAALNLGEEAFVDACDVADGVIEEPVATAATTAFAAALFILVPAIPALIGTLHIMGASARGISRKQRI